MSNVRRDTRRLSAAQRIEAAKNRTPEEQLARLDAALGVGVGATKERAKLAKRIKAALKAPKTKKVE